MVERIDWFNNCIERMVAGKKPLTPRQWGGRDSIIARDVDLLKQAAQFNSLRPGAARPDPEFISRLRERMQTEIGGGE